jgi:signal transduction histidine kinase
MHYTGMAAMRMEPPVHHSTFLVTLSIAIAIAAATISLWSAFRLRMETLLAAFWKKAGSAVVMGMAIYGMHYIGMAAAEFAPGSVSTANPQNFDHPMFAAVLGAFTLLFLMGSLLVSAYEAYRASGEVGGLTRRLVEVQDEERRALAAELHDIVGQNLSAVNTELALIRTRVPAASEALASASGLVKESVDAIRHVMARLRPPGLEELGLPAALRWHARNFEARSGAGVTVTADETLPRASPRVEDALLRIYLEALANVAKHAAARHVDVTLERRNGRIVLAITDNGRGFDPSRSSRRDARSGWGLRLMKERAESAGVELRVESATGTGTTVELTVSAERWS